MSSEHIQFECKDNVGIVTINRPPSNAIHAGMIQEFLALIPKLRDNPEVRSVLITSALEKIFLAGADISFLQELNKASESAKEGDGPPDSALQRSFDLINALPKPVIACINGHAMGGGCELALACHYRLMASDQGKIGLTEVNLGIIPGAGGTQRMVRVLGMSRALPLLLEGTRLTPQEALEIGLVHALYPKDELFDKSMELAKRLASQPPIAMAEILRCVREGGEATLERGLEIETEGIFRCLPTEDAKEGFQAFFEKRKANFKGK